MLQMVHTLAVLITRSAASPGREGITRQLWRLFLIKLKTKIMQVVTFRKSSLLLWPTTSQLHCLPSCHLTQTHITLWYKLSSVQTRARNQGSQRFTITKITPTRAFFWLEAPTSAFTFKNLLRHYANQTTRHMWLLQWGPNFTSTFREVNASIA